ncbi:MAG: AMP-binding protein, partial [Ilumatobacteraceae bacterium]
MDTDALPPVLTLPDLVRRAVVERPDAEAVTDGRDRLSWVDYDRRIGLVAAALGRAGARRGDRVAVLTPKSVHAFVAVHAIQRAGAVVVPIDWFAPTAVVRAVLADAEPTAVVGVLDAAHRSAVGDGVHIVDPTDPHVLSGTAAAGPVVAAPRPDAP